MSRNQGQYIHQSDWAVTHVFVSYLFLLPVFTFNLLEGMIKRGGRLKQTDNRDELRLHGPLGQSTRKSPLP